jgi:hypothetical protein
MYSFILSTMPSYSSRVVLPGGERTLEFAHHIQNLRLGPFVGFFEVRMLIRVHVGDDRKSARAVVEDQNGVRDHENHVWQAEFVLRRRGQRRLKEAHHVVGQVTNRAAVENWQRGRIMRAEGLHQRLEFRQRIGFRRETALLAALLDFDLLAACGENDARRAAEQ